MNPHDAEYWSVPRLWPGETVVCIGGGPSLVPEDVRQCRGRAKVIAINNAYLLAPWADILFAVGLYTPAKSWWHYHPDAAVFLGLKVTMDYRYAEQVGAKLVRRGDDATGVTGLSDRADTLNHGWNGGYAAIDLAVKLGAARILLLGYDMQPAPDHTHHWHPDHPGMLPPPYIDWLLAFDTLPKPLAALGVKVYNCSRSTALRAFPHVPLAEAWPCLTT